MNSTLLQILVELEPDVFNVFMTAQEVTEAIKEGAAARGLEVETKKFNNCFFARVGSSYRTDYDNLINPLMRAYAARVKYAKGLIE